MAEVAGTGCDCSEQRRNKSQHRARPYSVLLSLIISVHHGSSLSTKLSSQLGARVTSTKAAGMRQLELIFCPQAVPALAPSARDNLLHHAQPLTNLLPNCYLNTGCVGSTPQQKPAGTERWANSAGARATPTPIVPLTCTAPLTCIVSPPRTLQAAAWPPLPACRCSAALAARASCATQKSGLHNSPPVAQLDQKQTKSQLLLSQHMHSQHMHLRNPRQHEPSRLPKHHVAQHTLVHLQLVL